jgi:hypothetical protein
LSIDLVLSGTKTVAYTTLVSDELIAEAKKSTIHLRNSRSRDATSPRMPSPFLQTAPPSRNDGSGGLKEY